jgi:hypothetical protein
LLTYRRFAVTPKLTVVALPIALAAVLVTVAVAGAGTGETPATAAKKPVEFELHDLYMSTTRPPATRACS